MLTIDRSGNVTVNRGDTFNVPLFIDVEKDIFKCTRFPLHDEDVVIFHLVEPNQPFERYLVEQKYTKEDINNFNDIELKFVHDDTSWIAPGTYYYEIKLYRPYEEKNEDALVTIVPRRKFIIL